MSVGHETGDESAEGEAVIGRGRGDDGEDIAPGSVCCRRGREIEQLAMLRRCCVDAMADGM